MGRPKLPENKKKIKKTYKFSPDVIKLIDKRSTKLGMSKTGYLEALVITDNS